MEKKLPVYKLTINENVDSTVEVDAVALVDMPAIGVGFYAFNEQQMQAFAVMNEEERVVIGPAMIPDKKIFRRDEDGTEYEVFFTKDTIRTIAEKFYRKGFQNNGNEMHDSSKPVDMVFFQSWIADESKGIPKMKQFESLPDGTWFLGAKVNSDEAWAKVKDGTFKGFSVEGMFDMMPIKMSMKMSEEAAAKVVIDKLKELLQNVC
jgi:hypothetical protein